MILSIRPSAGVAVLCAKQGETPASYIWKLNDVVNRAELPGRAPARASQAPGKPVLAPVLAGGLPARASPVHRKFGEKDCKAAHAAAGART